MKLELSQGSEEWKNIRRTKITASDAAIILRLNPWTSPKELFDQKMGFTEVVENDVMRRGTEMEPIARQAYIEKKGWVITPEVHTSKIHPWMMASFDGVGVMDNGAPIIVEIKCGEKSFKEAKKGKIPLYYQCQLMHQMIVKEAKYCHYWAFNGTDGILLPYLLNERVAEKMVPIEKEFYDCLINAKEPDYLEDDLLEIHQLLKENS